jgi:hypothetical protein
MNPYPADELQAQFGGPGEGLVERAGEDAAGFVGRLLAPVELPVIGLGWSA